GAYAATAGERGSPARPPHELAASIHATASRGCSCRPTHLRPHARAPEGPRRHGRPATRKPPAPPRQRPPIAHRARTENRDHELPHRWVSRSTTVAMPAGPSPGRRGHARRSQLVDERLGGDAAGVVEADAAIGA